MKNEFKNYLLVGLLVLVVLVGFGCTATTFTVGTEEGAYFPIAKDMFGKGGSLDFLVYPMAWLMNLISNIVANNYALTILLSTVLIRSIAWPIYGKTNDMSLKMQLLGPEQAKIEEKYANKTDRESQQRKSMETMQLYKKYKVSFTGCLMPIIQMPIFLAFYETLRRIPFTIPKYITTFVDKNGNELIVNELVYNFGNLKTNLLGIDLMQTAGSEWNWQRWGVYIIALLVGLTQIGTQLLTQRRTNKQKRSLESNVPEYRRKAATSQQQQTEKMMKIMLYSMPVVMVIFIVTNTAALGWYWLVGNLYTGFQSFISAKQSEKRMSKLKEKYSEKSFIIGTKR